MDRADESTAVTRALQPHRVKRLRLTRLDQAAKSISKPRGGKASLRASAAWRRFCADAIEIMIEPHRT